MPYPFYDDTNYGGEGSRTSSWDEYYSKIGYDPGSPTGFTDPNTPGIDKGAIRRRNTAGQDIFRGIFGGPVGWYEIASGKGLLGGSDPFDGTTLNANMTEDVYNSMSPEEWASFAKMNGGEQDNFIASRKKRIAKMGPEIAKRRAEEKKLADEKAAREQQQKDIIKKVTEFAAEMNMPVSELMQRDEFAQQLNRTTWQNSQGSGMLRGAGAGGLSTQNADMATKRALLGYQMQRQAAGQQAYNSAYGMINNMGIQSEDLARYNQGLDLQMQQAQAAARMQQYMQGLGAAQGKAGMIGGIIGGVYGGPTGAAMGQQIGSNMGGMRYQGNTPFQTYQFSYPSTTRGSSGGGTAGLGGNY